MCLLHLVIKVETNSRNKVFTSKQTANKVLPLFLDVKVFGERFAAVCRHRKATSKVRRVQLVFKKLKVSRE